MRNDSEHDRELLELAAKAAGYKFDDWHMKWADGHQLFEWNPLIDDGDALRLAVRLEFVVNTEQFMHWGMCSYVTGAYWRRQGLTGSSIETHGTDPLAATRRAIVRAAAEIGRSMQ